MQKTKRPLSFLLAVLMIVGMFAAVPFTASAEDKVIGEGVIFKQGDTIVLPGNGIYIKRNQYESAREVHVNGTVTQFESDGYSYRLKIEEWGVYTYLDTFGYWEEMEQGLSVLGITFSGSGTESDPYMPKLALGEVESTWAGDGEGTEDAPWLIKDLNDLRTLSANVASGMTYSGKYLKLTTDIDCGSDNWETIGGDKSFAGTFDGDGKTITYSIICSENDAPKGLFAKIGSAGTVKNLNVAGSIVNTAAYAGPAGGIAAYNSGLIENCYSAVDINKGCDRGTGGIAAWNDEGATIRYCAASGTLTWTGGSDFYAYIGGITGENYNYDVVSMTNCAMLGDVLAQNSDGDNYVGRLIGRQYNADSALDCYYLDTMTVTGVVNSDSVTAKTADELKAIGQAAIDAGYTVYGLALGGSLSNPDQEAADAVIALIDTIGTVEYTDVCKEKIDAARAAYDALTATQKDLVTNYTTLTAAETAYAELETEANTVRIGSVDDWNSFAESVKNGNTYSGKTVLLTADVGPVTTMVEGTFSGTFDGDGYTLTVDISGGTVATFQNAANAVFQNFTLAGSVTGSGIHTGALVKSITGGTCSFKNVIVSANVNGAKGYVGGFVAHAGNGFTVSFKNCLYSGSINHTGTQGNFIGAFIGWSQNCTATIENCAFTGSYSNTKSFNNIGFSYNAPRSVTVSDFYSNASEVFVANVNRGTRLYTPGSYTSVEGLVINGDEWTFFTQYSDALSAAQSGGTLLMLDKAVTDAEALINAIGTVEYTDESKDKIDEARAAYDALTDTQKTLVTNYTTLTDAETAYANLEAAADVIAKINAIGTVEYTDACKAKIDDARAAYDTLSDDQKALVTNADALTTAETTYANLKAAAEEAAAALATAKADAKDALAAYKNAADYRPAQQTELTNAINAGNDAIDGAADITGVNTALANAKTAIDAIKTDAQLTAEETAAALAQAKTDAKAELAAYKNAADYRPAQQTELTNAINAGNDAIDGAEDIAGVNTALANAKTAIDAIKTDAELTAEEDQAAANAAMDKINAIGTVAFTYESKAKIDAAREAYDDLTDAQQALVTNYKTLTDAEEAYVALEAAAPLAITLSTDDNVLFTSVAVGGKPSDIVFNDQNKPVMSPVGKIPGSDRKQTVLDESRSNFYADCRGLKDGICKIGYSKAKSTENDVISGMIVDADGNVKYYGVLGYANPAPLTVFPFDVSGQYEVGDRIYIFNEYLNGDNMTDYSSPLIDVTPEKLPEGLTATAGQTLADVAIPNPEGNTDGTWTWDDTSIPVDTVGEYTFAATFTPGDTSKFDIVHTNLTVTVTDPDQDAADAVIALIGEIGTVEYTDASKEKIDAARTAYDKLTDAQKALVSNDETLTAAEARYAELKAAEELAAAKRTAKSALLSYKDTHDYRAEQKAELSNAIDDGIAAINAATNTDEVAAALEAAKAVMDAIKTDAQLTAEEELAAAKTDAKAELDSYKNAADYRAAQQTELADAIAEGKTAIENAADTDAVATALANAKAAIDAIKTDAQLTAEETAAALAQAKTDAKAELANYKDPADYRPAQQTELTNAINAGNAAIDAATSTDGVATALENAKAAIDAIKTDAELTAEEEAAALVEKAKDWVSVRIDDQICINFLLAQRDDFESVKIEYIDQDLQTATKTIVYDDLSKLTIREGHYLIPVVIAPAQIGDTIKATLTVGGQEIEYTMSVKEYCEYLIANYDDVKVTDLAKATLEYGQAANDYFAGTGFYNASEITTITEALKQENIDAAKAQNNLAITGDVSNMLAGASFMALTKPEFRFYFNNSLTDEKAVQLNENGQITTNVVGVTAMFYKNPETGAILLEVKGIKAEDMDKVITITVGDLGTITFSGNDFARMMANSSNTSVATLGTALYLYGVKAKECFA